jgi:hypothetical protein
MSSAPSKKDEENNTLTPAKVSKVEETVQYLNEKKQQEMARLNYAKIIQVSSHEWLVCIITIASWDLTA